MKAAAATTVLTVDFRKKRAPRPTVAPTGRVPRVARLLALAHKIDSMIKDGELRDLAEAARVVGITRARMTQLMNLLLLSSTTVRSGWRSRSRPVAIRSSVRRLAPWGSSISRC